MATIDQHSDPALAHLTLYLQEMPALEGFVKTASIDSSEIDALPETAFAWPEQRKYPLHDAQHAAISYSYAKHAEELPPGVLSRITDALEVYGVPETLFDTVKVAHEEDPADWLCPDLKLFHVKTAAEFSAAEHQFLDNYEKLDIEHRATAAQNLVKKAQEFKLPVHNLAMKTAGLTVSHRPTLQQWIVARAEAAKTVAHKDVYHKLAADLNGFPEELGDRDALFKLADGLAELDARTGVDRHYDRRLPDALQSVFNTDKVAAETVDINGSMIPLSKLAALPASFWEDLGGKDLSDEVCPGGRMDSSKLAAVVGTLPMDLKAVLKAQLRG